MLGLDFHRQQPSYTTLISPAVFSRPLIRARYLPVTSRPKDIGSLRADYETMVPLQVEPRGERVGFFTQVKYLVKGMGIATGLMVIAGVAYVVASHRSRLP